MSYTAAMSDLSIDLNTRLELSNIAMEYANAVTEYVYEQRILEDMCAKHLTWEAIDEQMIVIEDMDKVIKSIKAQLVSKARYIGTAQFLNR